MSPEILNSGSRRAKPNKGEGDKWFIISPYSTCLNRQRNNKYQIRGADINMSEKG